MSIQIAKLDGGAHTFSSEDLDALGASVHGDVFTPGSEGYEESRTIWNAMIDKKPGLVIKCSGTADVCTGVKLAAEHGLQLGVRGAGHHIAGNSLSEGGLQLDLSGLRSVHVDPVAKTARVQPGATLGDVDHETQLYGLALPMGINTTTGIAGLTLGGGFGWISRKYGMTIDSLRSAEVVTADGKVTRASAQENPDLFWAIRGGGGNFGVVTSFEFDLYEVGPTVLSGLIIYPFAEGKDVLQNYRAEVGKMSNDLTVWAVLRKAPPLPFLPEEWHGKEVVIIAACYAGDMAKGEEELKSLRSFGNPIADVIGPHPWVGWQSAFDALLGPGARNYWKSHNFTELSDGLIDTVLDATGKLPSDLTEIFMGSLGGKVNTVPADATAYPHRDAEYVMNVHTRWETPGEDAACVAWARDVFKNTEQYATGGVYINFVPEDEDRVTNAYGGNYAKLQEIKKKYDPQNLFRVNHNIKA